MIARPRVTCAHSVSRHSTAVRPVACRVPANAHARLRVARHSLCVRATAAPAVSTPPPAITLTDNALEHLKKLKAENKDSNVLLRVGVRQGGCSGMSYHMDFEKEENIAADDYVMPYDDGEFRLVCDPKSLLYLFGMRLDYSNALIGGGFQFNNPNAADTCGCGKSFGV